MKSSVHKTVSFQYCYCILSILLLYSEIEWRRASRPEGSKKSLHLNLRPSTETLCCNSFVTFLSPNPLYRLASDVIGFCRSNWLIYKYLYDHLFLNWGKAGSRKKEFHDARGQGGNTDGPVDREACNGLCN